jgi:hypothetical protein
MFHQVKLRTITGPSSDQNQRYEFLIEAPTAFDADEVCKQQLLTKNPGFPRHRLLGRHAGVNRNQEQ